MRTENDPKRFVLKEGFLFLERWFLNCIYIRLYMMNISTIAPCNKWKYLHVGSTGYRNWLQVCITGDGKMCFEGEGCLVTVEGFAEVSSLFGAGNLRYTHFYCCVLLIPFLPTPFPYPKSSFQTIYLSFGLHFIPLFAVRQKDSTIWKSEAICNIICWYHSSKMASFAAFWHCRSLTLDTGPLVLKV